MLPKSPDLFVLTVAFSNFILFLGLHIVLLRWNEKLPANRALSVSFAFGILIQGLIAFMGMRGFLSLGFSGVAFTVSMVASLLIYTCLAFHYLVWVFGMGEAAIRIRLLRELDRTPSKSVSLREICLHYNVDKILQSRLERLVSAGHLHFDGQYYSIRKKILLVQAQVEKMVKVLLGIPSC